MIRYILECCRDRREFLESTLILTLSISIEFRELGEGLQLVWIRDRYCYLGLTLLYGHLAICDTLEREKIHHDSEDQYESSDEWDLIGEAQINYELRISQL